MKYLLVLILGTALALSVFGAPTNASNMMNQMSAAEHASMMNDCTSGACEQVVTNCAEHCFVASGFQIDTGVLPLTTLLLIVAAVAATLLSPITVKAFFPQFQPIAYRDPRLILSTQKRE